MGLYETLKRAIGLRTPKDDFDQVQRMLKESGDAFALEYERNPEFRLRLQQERQRDIEAGLTLREGTYWFRNSYYERGPFCTVCWDVDRRLVETHRKISGNFACGYCAARTLNR